MEFSEKSKKIIDSCRFCWMCRHICPIGNATGKECNTARARALSLSLVTRGAAGLEGDIVDNVYECALCGGCTADCATGWDPVVFTKEARLNAALEGNMPAYVEKLVENIDATGNIYGAKKVPAALAKAVKELPETADVLFFIGKDGTYKTPDKAAKAVELLTKAGVKFAVMKKEPDSGYAYDFLIGASDETKKTMTDTAALLNKNGAKTIVCYDPADAKIFLREYKEYGIKLNAKVVTFPAYVASLIKSGALKVKKSKKKFTLQDSPIMSRDLEDSESARKVLNACGGLHEMLLFGKATMLAGNLIMNEYMPGTMKLVALNRWANVKGVEGKTVVTESPAEYAALANTNADKTELITLEEAVLSCL